ncbi:ANTAR domain-containing protein [Knoellia aerolata]|uniref:ANTAR domain-containing protein n=1 Tax=Knoellia aerolata DSM 18566 TaxID=1385519 RepID=A0A0A0JR27_9MICO|nr:ANTAR domain-containing protein [Knoellia aerolata]KGN39658.1 hypothetical protein N801_19665 [Knoellia aerolata DSM 18566]
MADVDDLLSQLARRIVRGVEQGLPLPTRLCQATVDLLGCDGGAITLAYTLLERVTLCTTNDTARILEEAQDVVGQGPGPDAFTTGVYQRFDLTVEDGPNPRWPLLESQTLTALAPLVVHALPLGEPDHMLGVLTLHQAGSTPPLDIDAARVVAKVLTAALLADAPTQHDLGHAPWAERAEVHQATGMVVAQLGVPESDAIALLRAHAYSHDQSVTASAHAVLTRQLTFSATPERKIEST